MPHVIRRKVVGVMGSGTEEHEALAAPLGRLVARLGAHLLTGGGQGVMRAVSRAFCEAAERRGTSIGVLPADISGYPNDWVEIAIQTHLPHSGERGTDPLSRNHINVLSSHAVVALPGAAGTASEVRLALEYGTPVIAFLGKDDVVPDLDPRVRVVRAIAEVEGFLRQSLGEPVSL
jgi:uncharacterized protein (TIGR00725 family)